MTPKEIDEVVAEALRKQQCEREQREGTREDVLKGIADDAQEHEKLEQEAKLKLLEKSDTKVEKITLKPNTEWRALPPEQAMGFDPALHAAMAVGAAFAVGKQYYDDRMKPKESPEVKAVAEPPMYKQAGEMADRTREAFERRHEQLGTDKETLERARKQLDESLRKEQERRVIASREREGRKDR